MFDSRPKMNQPRIFLENIIPVSGLVRHFIIFRNYQKIWEMAADHVRNLKEAVKHTNFIIWYNVKL